MKNTVISFYMALGYVLLIFLLGFGLRDDYFLFTFPSWPFFIGCFEDCGIIRLMIATMINGVLVWGAALGALMLIDKLRRAT